MSTLKDDLKNDLLADLAPAAAEPPIVEPPAVPADRTTVTPVVALQLTPMRWSRPRLVTVGTGTAVRVGPLSLEVNVKP